MTRAPMMENRVWLLVTPKAGGGSELRFTQDQPAAPGVGQAVVRARGKLEQGDVVFDLPPRLTANQMVGTPLPDVTLIDSTTLAVLAGNRRKRTACAGAKTSDRLVVQPVAEAPAGYAIAEAVCTENGWIRVSYSGPALQALASVSIPLHVTALRGSV